VKPLLSWDGSTLPRVIRLTPDERGVLLPIGSSFQLGKVEPAPFLSAEMQLWTKPTAAIAFPIHPVGAAELFRRAAEVVGRSSALAVLDAEERRTLQGYLWAAAAKLYAPGQSIRSAIDDFGESRGYLPSELKQLDNPKDDRRKGLALLAGAAAIRAACEWAAEGA
jgi:hypothetical protein